MIDSRLYWLLPGPKGFVHKIAACVDNSRVLVVNLPRKVLPGTYDGIAQGLRDAHVREQLQLTIRGQMNIADEIGSHFGYAHAVPAHLAAQVCPQPTAVVLRAEDDEAQARCERYAMDFMAATKHHDGNVKLVTTLHDPRFQRDSRIEDVQVITFDGGLTADEMDAYVSLRMIDRPGPGSTRLLRAITSEFAGFDAQFAERLLQLGDEDLLSIRGHLSVLLNEDRERWRTLDWLEGARSINGASPHVLHDCYLAQHAGEPERQQAGARIEERFWRACVKVMYPWVEQRRRPILEYFMPQLRAMAAQDPDGKIQVPRGAGFRSIEPEELELNSIVGMAFSGLVKASTEVEVRALDACKAAKVVRDDISHRRAPAANRLRTLIAAVDALLD